MHNHARESGQVLPLMALLVIVAIGLLGLSADVGRIYAARAQLGRAVDAAALAGAKQLPNVAAADAKARAYIAANDPDATLSVQVYPDVPSQQVGVKATKTIDTVFMRIFGVKTVKVTNDALAGFGVVPVDAVMAIDATGSMGAAPCNASQNNSGCPIFEAKNAAKAFAGTLLPGANTVVGSTSFRGCFNAPVNNANCVSLSTVGSLDSSLSNVTSRINSMSAQGGTGTNVCLGLDKADQILAGVNRHTASNTVRVAVILTDGDNTYNAVSYLSGAPGAPPAACRPTSPSTSDTYLGNECSAPGQGSTTSSNPGSTAGPKERQLDTAAKARADAMKAAGVEIYVVAFGVCSVEDNAIASATYCSSGNIGNSDPDTIADQRLSKCLASSSGGTNDHYFRAAKATDLPGIFSAIAQSIAFRLIK
ncbi:MAG: VWA domain-containing protein [Chloroflexi bacterium]|nr:VWA domain-containing protein [Chloroflexota bacterium]